DLKAQASDALHDGDLEGAKALYQQILVHGAADSQDRLRAANAIASIAVQQAQPTTASTATAKDVSPAPQAPPQPLKPITLRLQPQKRGFFGKQPDPVKLELLPIPGGTFWMGQTEAEMRQLKQEAGEEKYQKFFARELPRHQVTVPPFWMGRYPVTQAQYEAVMGENPVKGKAFCWTGKEWEMQQIPAKFLGEDRPVVGVNWDQAVAFCQKLTELCREQLQGGKIVLPTEAQWEFACRAGTETAFYFGDRLEPHQANYGCNQSYNGSKTADWKQVTTSVGSFPANAWGLQDMHGNVWEWCQDHYYEDYQKKPKACQDNGSIAWTHEFSAILLYSDEISKETRLLRGGSWYDHPVDCRSAHRNFFPPLPRSSSVGLRVVCCPA
ncbi:MAG: formylglycine-generating enzyme family protein, partial [Prochlorothrix sp.]|nr:formylglycine-generating enzyme family protein [Prochlorothrix sp.]